MTAAELRSEMASLRLSQRGFADFVGANERTVRGWATDGQDIPQWVPVMLGLMRQVAATAPGAGLI